MFSSALRFIFVFLFACGMFVTTHSQTLASRTLNSTVPAKGSVAGALTGPGLSDASGVRITLHGATSQEATQTTGADGRFVFYDIAPGSYSLDIDPSTLPQKYIAVSPQTVDVLPGTRAETLLSLEPRRSLVGHTYVDINNDGIYTPGKDTLIQGAQVSIGGRFVVSGPDGTFRIDELAAGRTSLVVTWPGSNRTTQVVLDLSPGPVTDRVVNVPLYR